MAQHGHHSQFQTFVWSCSRILLGFFELFAQYDTFGNRITHISKRLRATQLNEPFGSKQRRSFHFDFGNDP